MRRSHVAKGFATIEWIVDLSRILAGCVKHKECYSGCSTFDLLSVADSHSQMFATKVEHAGGDCV